MGAKSRPKYEGGPTPSLEELHRKLRGLIAPHLKRFFDEAKRRALGSTYTDPITKRKVRVEGDNRILLFLLEIGAGKASQPGDTGGPGRRPVPSILDYLDGAIDATLAAAIPDRTPVLDEEDLRQAPPGKPVLPYPDEGDSPEDNN